MVHRAVITGIGVLSPLGSTRDVFTQGVLEGRSGIEKIEAFDTGYFRTPYGGEIRDFDPSKNLSEEEAQKYPDRHLQLAVAAARDALKSSQLSPEQNLQMGTRMGLVVGTCNGGLKTAELQYSILAGKQEGTFSRDTVLLLRYHTLGKALSHSLGIVGPSWIVTTACSSSTAALGVALELIENDMADRLLVGGVDALCMASMAGFDTLKATADGTKTAPFSTPVGLNLGEASAFWIVEKEELAAARGATIEGELCGYALTSDAYHPTSPDPRGDGAYRTIQGALDRAKLSLEDLGCVNAHGTGTEANDRAESRGIGRLIGDKSIPVYSFKSQVGHCMGAAGIVEATAGLVAMQHKRVPATINFAEPRPGCTLDYVPNTPKDAEYNRFVSCNYAFGGNNAGIVVGLKGTGSQNESESVTRTVLTGGGSISSLGLGNQALLDALHKGTRGLCSVEGRVRGETSSQLAGYVAPFDAKQVDRRLDLKQMNLLSRYATAAARFALEEAGLRVSPKTGLDTGVITGVYVGPSEEDHMELVTRTDGEGGDISNFSHIVANATAGWVSNALLLKGYSCTVSQGADAGLFALGLAHLAIRKGTAKRILAGAADELYSRYYHNYDRFGMLYEPGEEQNYRLRDDVSYRRVLGEGAAYVVAESFESAKERGASILAELVGMGMTTDIDTFYEASRQNTGLKAAIEQALAGAGWSSDDIQAVIWSPQGNSSDTKTLEALGEVLNKPQGDIPLVTSVFHTGLCESTSGTATLSAMLSSWKHDRALWPSMTGNTQIDGTSIPQKPVPTLAIVSSDLGFNLALAIAPFKG